MSDFGNILKKGKKLFSTKANGGHWSRCEECHAMALLFDYVDNEKQVWKLCEQCISSFVKDEDGK